MTISPPKPMRGEIWEFDLDPKRGRERRGIRPCLVVSTDAMNRSEFGRSSSAPSRRHIVRASAGESVSIPPIFAARTWKPRPHWIATDQIVTVDAGERAIRHLATIATDEKLRTIDDFLRLMLDL